MLARAAPRSTTINAAPDPLNIRRTFSSGGLSRCIVCEEYELQEGCGLGPVGLLVYLPGWHSLSNLTRARRLQLAVSIIF